MTKTTLDAKVNKLKGEIPSITNLASTTALTVVENKISNVNNLVKKADYNTKINEIGKKITDHDHDKYIATPELLIAVNSRKYCCKISKSKFNKQK